ncbi:MAG: hypothetical protein WCI74_02515 [Actinomycetes bacterium]
MTRKLTSTGVRQLLASLLFCAILALALGLTSAVLKPGRSLQDGNAGAAWTGYLAQAPGHLDVVFFGTSHVFDGVDPSQIWRTRGIASYVMAGPAQKLDITKYYVREGLRTQKPKVVVVDLGAVTYEKDRFSRSFHDINVGYMPWGLNKLAAGVLSTPEGERVGALVDLWNYHGRWAELKRTDFNIVGKNGAGDTFMKGWLPLTSSRPVSSTPQPAAEDTKTLAAVDYNIAALREIAKATQAAGIPLVLTLMPTGPPGAYSSLLERASKPLLAEFDNVHVLDLSLPGAVPGLSYQTDFFDSGHLNYRGSEKASAALANYLATAFAIPDHRGDPAYSAWGTDVVKSRQRMESRKK